MLNNLAEGDVKRIETAGEFELEEDLTSSGDESTSSDIEVEANQPRVKRMCLEVLR